MVYSGIQLQCTCQSQPFHVHPISRLVDLIDLWSRSVSARWRSGTAEVSHVGHSSHSASGHSTHSWHSRHSSASLGSSVSGGDNRSPNILDLLLLGLIFLSLGIGVGVDPIDGLLHCVLDLLVSSSLMRSLNLASSNVFLI